jgi:hypothetical protein
MGSELRSLKSISSGYFKPPVGSPPSHSVLSCVQSWGLLPSLVDEPESSIELSALDGAGFWRSRLRGSVGSRPRSVDIGSEAQIPDF